MKTFINGEILTAEDLNENFLEVGGSVVTVSEDLPTSADGNDGEWWIMTSPSTFVLNDYFPDEFVGNWKVSYNSNTSPAAGKAHCTSNAGSVTTDVKFYINKTDNNGDMPDLSSLSVGKIMYLETFKDNDGSSYNYVAYQITAKATGANKYTIDATKLEFDGLSSWATDCNSNFYVGTDTPPSSPNTLFYKEDGEWIQIGGGSGGGSGPDENAVHTLENADDPSLKCTGIMTLTQAQYDALDGSRDPEVLYLVVE
jgi:hypothetical protein